MQPWHWMEKIQAVSTTAYHTAISLIRRGRLYSSCVRSSMLHGSETGLSAKKMRWHFSEQR